MISRNNLVSQIRAGVAFEKRKFQSKASHMRLGVWEKYFGFRTIWYYLSGDKRCLLQDIYFQSTSHLQKSYFQLWNSWKTHPCRSISPGSYLCTWTEPTVKPISQRLRVPVINRLPFYQLSIIRYSFLPHTHRSSGCH